MVVAAVLLVVGVVGAVQALRLGLGQLSEPGPGFLPFCVAVTLAVVAAVLVLRPHRPPPSAEQTAATELPWTRVVIVFAGLLFFAAALEWLGFVVTTFLFFCVIFGGAERYRWPLALAASAGTAIILHVVFTLVGVRLPIAFWSR